MINREMDQDLKSYDFKCIFNCLYEDSGITTIFEICNKNTMREWPNHCVPTIPESPLLECPTNIRIPYIEYTVKSIIE